MSGCTCGRSQRGPNDSDWVVTQYHCNHSAYNSYRYTPSDYSEVTCRRCGAVWRTKAGYVEHLPRDDRHMVVSNEDRNPL